MEQRSTAGHCRESVYEGQWRKRTWVSCREITSVANASFVEHVQVVQLPGYQRGVVVRVELPPDMCVTKYVGEWVQREEQERRLELYETVGLRHTYMLDVSGW